MNPAENVSRTAFRHHGIAALARLVAPIVFVVWNPAAFSGSAGLVRDIFPGNSATSRPGLGFDQIVGTSDERLYFRGFLRDWSLSTTDGTSAGTRLLTDVYADSGVDINGTFFFTAATQERGSLWKSDGTTAGTVFVKRFSPDPGVPARAGRLTKVGGLLFFVVDDGVHGAELWKSDGTEAGTVLVKDITPGSAGSFDYLAEFVDLNGTLIFTCGLSPGCGLWKSDGTPSGTLPVTDLSNPSNLTVVNGTLFFAAGDTARGRELWKSDGTTAGTVLVKDIVPGPADSRPTSLAPLGGMVVFALDVNGPLWRSDGTEAGTVPVAPVVTAAPLVPAGGLLFFSDGGSQLWRTDGTPGGTFPVRSFDSLKSLLSAMPRPESLLFWADDGVHGSELWRSDGTVAGTTLVKDLTPGPSASTPWTTYFQAALVGGLSFFALNEGTGGLVLYRTDGTEAGTAPVQDPVFPPNNSDPLWLTDANGVLFFSADDGVHGHELWRSDGTPAGTFLVKDINPGPASSTPRNTAATSRLFFLGACEPTTGCELWRSDGTETGTRLVKDLQPGPLDGYRYPLLTLGDLLLFLAADGVNGTQVWRSDGTEAGTFLLKDTTAGDPTTDFAAIGVLNGLAHFVAQHAASADLWRTDGTPDGTVVVGVIPGVAGSGARLGNALIFPVNDATSGTAIWRTDGTGGGTTLLKTVNPLPGQHLSGFSTTSADRVVFWADDGTYGSEPWVTDGTPSGTKLLKDINPGPPSSVGPGICVLGSTLFFSAYDGAHGYELWKTDGTETGTVLVRDIAPGPAGSMFVENLVAAGHEIFFTSSDHVHGREIWRTDDTNAGTKRVTDILPGISSGLNSAFFSRPVMAGLVRSGSHIFFVATDGTTGYELWSLPFGRRFFTVDPCRLLDTRNPDGPSGGPALAAGTTRNFPVWSGCSIPSSAAVVSGNVTVTAPTNSGYLTLFPAGTAVPAASTINFARGQTRANNIAVELGTSGGLSVFSGLASGTVHVVLDVNGYWE